MNKQSETKILANDSKLFLLLYHIITLFFFFFNKKKDSNNLNLEMYKETELKEKLELT
jgi:hypothetical protein